MVKEYEIMKRLENKDLCTFAVDPISKVDIWIKNAPHKDAIDTFIDFCNASKSDIVLFNMVIQYDCQRDEMLKSGNLNCVIEKRIRDLGLKKLFLKNKNVNEATLKLEVQEKYQNYLKSIEKFMVGTDTSEYLCGYQLYTCINNTIFGIEYSDNEFWSVYDSRYLDKLLKEYCE